MKRRSKWKLRRKRWLDRKSQKLARRKRKKIHALKRGITDKNGLDITLTPPEIFSFTHNTEETMKFFMELTDKINKGQHGTSIFIDSGKVKTVSVDALIYLIATIQNNYMCLIKRIACTGNYPENEDARKIYYFSGFNSYVKSKVKALPHPKENVKITDGLRNNPDVAKQCCIFVIDKLKKTRVQTRPLQTTLIELMSNAFHHAYDKRNLLDLSRWYIYAELTNNYIHFIFVDTGLGIATTVRKNFPEKIQQLLSEIFSLGLNDAQLIASAFNGDFRTATNEKNRGNGLTTVREVMQREPFENFEVISGHGRYSIINSKISAINYNHKIYGTLFTFNVR